MDNTKWLEMATDMAERSTIKRHSTGAVIVARRSNSAKEEKIATGWSHMSEYSLVAYKSIHAEIHALLRCDRYLLKGAIIFVSTINNSSGNIVLSRPCDQCLATIFEVGIKRAVFTTQGANYDYLEVNGG